MSIEARILELNLTLPEAPAAAGTYNPVVIIDKLAYVSGQGPVGTDGRWLTGKVGSELTEEQGIAAALPVGEPLPILARLDSDWLRQLRNRWEAANTVQPVR